MNIPGSSFDYQRGAFDIPGPGNRQRGYVISGMPEYLQPYQTAVGSAMSSIDRLAELVKQDMVQSTSVQKLRRLAQKKIEITGKIIVLRQQAVSSRAQQLLTVMKSGDGQIRIVLAQVQAAETSFCTSARSMYRPAPTTP